MRTGTPYREVIVKTLKLLRKEILRNFDSRFTLQDLLKIRTKNHAVILTKPLD